MKFHCDRYESITIPISILRTLFSEHFDFVRVFHQSSSFEHGVSLFNDCLFEMPAVGNSACVFLGRGVVSINPAIK